MILSIHCQKVGRGLLPSLLHLGIDRLEIVRSLLPDLLYPDGSLLPNLLYLGIDHLEVVGGFLTQIIYPRGDFATRLIYPRRSLVTQHIDPGVDLLEAGTHLLS